MTWKEQVQQNKEAERLLLLAREHERLDEQAHRQCQHLLDAVLPALEEALTRVLAKK